MPGWFDNNNNILIIIIIIQNFFCASNKINDEKAFLIFVKFVCFYTQQTIGGLYDNWKLEQLSLSLSFYLSTDNDRYKIDIFKEILLELNFFFRIKRKVSKKKSHVTFLFSSKIIHLQLAQQLAPVLKHAANIQQLLQEKLHPVQFLWPFLIPENNSACWLLSTG